VEAGRHARPLPEIGKPVARAEQLFKLTHIPAPTLPRPRKKDESKNFCEHRFGNVQHSTSNAQGFHFTDFWGWALNVEG
jgi:hypothetical protein